MIKTENIITGRIGWVDYAKCLALYVVVLVHTHCTPMTYHVCNSFVMPVLFFLSGFLFSRKRNPHYGPFVWKRTRQLVFPYLWLSALAYVCWVFVLRYVGEDAAEAVAWYEPLVATLLGIPARMVHDVPLWSLLTFFFVEIIFYPLSKWKVPDWLTFVVFFALACAVNGATDGFSLYLPFVLEPLPMGLAMYAFGHLAGANRRALEVFFRPSAIAAMLGAVLFVPCVQYNSTVMFYVGKLGNPLLFMGGAIGGIILMIQLSGVLEYCFRDGAFVRFVSRGTLLICGFHLLVMAAVKGVALYVFHITPDVLAHGVVHGLLLAAVVYALTLPIIWLIDTKLPWLVNK